MASTKEFNRARTAVMRAQTACRAKLESGVRCGRDERGAAMVEYGLLLAFALLVAFAVVLIFGQRVLGLFESVESEFRSVNPNNSPT